MLTPDSVPFWNLEIKVFYCKYDHIHLLIREFFAIEQFKSKLYVSEVVKKSLNYILTL